MFEDLLRRLTSAAPARLPEPDARLALAGRRAGRKGKAAAREAARTKP